MLTDVALIVLIDNGVLSLHTLLQVLCTLALLLMDELHQNGNVLLTKVETADLD
mgnify:CR=1 FL=1